jgi:lactoylglutathione lyase
MKLGYTILYVPDVAASLAFYGKAFGLSTRFLHESGTYGELETGDTTLFFAAHSLADSNFPGGHVQASSSPQPLGMEVAIVTQDVAAAHASALAHGATELAPHPGNHGARWCPTSVPQTVVSSSCARLSALSWRLSAFRPKLMA